MLYVAPGAAGGSQGGRQPPLLGWKKLFWCVDPLIGGPTHVLCMSFHMVLGYNGFRPRVFFYIWSRELQLCSNPRFMYTSACIYMCYKTKRNIMKNQVGRPDLGSRGKSLCLSILCFMLSRFFIFCYKIRV